MFERFTQDVREKVRRAAELADHEGAAMVEVEHLLLALVDPVTDQIGMALERAGLSRETINDARDREFRSALALAGVNTGRPVPAGARRLRRGRTTRFAPSAKLALERTLGVAAESNQQRITNQSLVLAIVGAQVGIIPRLLAELGTDSETLANLIRTSI